MFFSAMSLNLPFVSMSQLEVFRNFWVKGSFHFILCFSWFHFCNCFVFYRIWFNTLFWYMVIDLNCSIQKDYSFWQMPAHRKSSRILVTLSFFGIFFSLWSSVPCLFYILTIFRCFFWNPSSHVFNLNILVRSGQIGSKYSIVFCCNLLL